VSELPLQDGVLTNSAFDRMTEGDPTAENILDRLSDPENYPHEAPAPYEEIGVNGNVYYFTPGGFLYRKDPRSEEVGGCFCGYLTDEVWPYRTDDG
jgi:hypothetical protein